MEMLGRVLAVNVSRGGVPKLPVDGAWVRRLGVEGDAHREDTVHGGPHRAVCLFAIEAVERLQAEGHPVEPGSVGENLTTAGVEWSTLPIGTRARVGERLLLEIASSTTPCATQRHNFVGGQISRINIALHPSDSRMYARVLEEGYVRPGDTIVLLPPAPQSRAPLDALLDRFDRPERMASLKLWAAARTAGYDVRVLDDGDICAGASRELPEPAFNHAQGLRAMPQLLPRIVRHFERVGSAGLVPHVAPAPGAQPTAWMGVHAASADELVAADPVAGLAVARVEGADDLADYIDTYVAESPQESGQVWRTLLPHLLDGRDVHAFLARLDGEPAGVGLLYVRRQAGLLRGGFVRSRVRGRGVQAALIAARAAHALELGCDLVVSMAPVDSGSARNLERRGVARIDSHPVYEFVPARASDAVPAAR